MTKDDVLTLIQQGVKAAGSQRAFACQCNVTTQYINDILRGRRDPGPKVLDMLGIEKTTVYNVSYRLRGNHDQSHSE